MLLSGGEKFSPYYGGALARWTYEVYRRLASEVDVTVFGSPTTPADRYELPHQASPVSHVCRLLSHVPGARRYEDRIWLQSLLNQLRTLDVIHIHNRPQWVTVLRRLGFGGGLVLHLQNDHLGHWNSSMLDALAADVDAIAVCSTFLRETFAARSGRAAAKTHVIFNGVDTGVFFPREELRERKTIFFVGRFHREKGVLELVRAYHRVLEVHPDAKLVIGGTSGFGVHRQTPYVREVREVAAFLTTEHAANVHFAGYLHHDNDLPAWFQKATVFVCPSLFEEPFGLVNAEAMACGTPVVAANRGGIPEVLDTTGKLVNPEDTVQFAAALSELLSQSDHQKELGRRALERCRANFDWSVIAQVWSSLLRDVTPRRGGFQKTGT